PPDLLTFPTRRSSDLFTPLLQPYPRINDGIENVRHKGAGQGQDRSDEVERQDDREIAVQDRLVPQATQPWPSEDLLEDHRAADQDRKSTRLNSSHEWI